MPSTYNRRAFLEAARGQLDKVRQLTDDLKQVRAKHLERIEQIEREAKEAGDRLAAFYLPDFKPDTLRLAGIRIKDPQFARDLIARRDRREAELKARLQKLATDDRVLHSNRYIHPDAGQLTQKLIEARGFLETWSAALTPFESDDRFTRLYNAGYGQPHYARRWYHLQYYRDWRDGDEFMDAMGGKPWTELIPEYEKTRAERNRWQASVSEIQRAIQDVRDLLEEHTRKTAELANLEETMLQEARTRLLQVIRSTAPSVLSEGAQDPALAAQLTQVNGLNAKVEYLKGLVNERLEPDQAALDQQIVGLEKDIAKWSRPKMVNATVPADRFEKRFRDPVERYHQRWEKVDRYSSTVYGFDAWDRVRLVDDLLWWDVMTDGRLDGRFLPSVRGFYETHPRYQYQPWRDDARDAAVAAVIGEREDATEWGDAS